MKNEHMHNKKLPKLNGKRKKTNSKSPLISDINITKIKNDLPPELNEDQEKLSKSNLDNGDVIDSIRNLTNETKKYFNIINSIKKNQSTISNEQKNKISIFKTNPIENIQNKNFKNELYTNSYRTENVNDYISNNIKENKINTFKINDVKNITETLNNENSKNSVLNSQNIYNSKRKDQSTENMYNQSVFNEKIQNSIKYLSNTMQVPVQNESFFTTNQNNEKISKNNSNKSFLKIENTNNSNVKNENQPKRVEKNGIQMVKMYDSESYIPDFYTGGEMTVNKPTIMSVGMDRNFNSLKESVKVTPNPKNEYQKVVFQIEHDHMESFKSENKQRQQSQVGKNETSNNMMVDRKNVVVASNTNVINSMTTFEKVVMESQFLPNWRMTYG